MAYIAEKHLLSNLLQTRRSSCFHFVSRLSDEGDREMLCCDFTYYSMSNAKLGT